MKKIQESPPSFRGGVVQAYNDDNVSIDKIYDALEEFNKLNNLTPIDPSTLE